MATLCEPTVRPRFAHGPEERLGSAADRWRRVEAIYHEALARPEAERSTFVSGACAGDADLQREVEALLAHSQSDDRFLGQPIGALAEQFVVTSASAESILVGRRIGPYEVRSVLGAGGMGQVYRARDTQLGRDVAIKVLPSAFMADRDRLARFEREARILASLNHPNIATIHAVEPLDGSRALVMELVDGPTLADRIARGPVPIDEALRIAIQIAGALEAAHEQGIVHRDLKPANVKLRPDGAVKVLDFGLAKIVRADRTGEAVGVASAGEEAPTLSFAGTREGMVLGTAAYMSPEQARGQAVDKRTDIWAFGCVLYELLSGRLAFPGQTTFDRIAAILEREPDWSALPRTTSSSVQRVLRRCLEKDPKRRLHHIADARIDLEDVLRTGDLQSSAPSAVALQRRRFRPTIAWLAATSLLSLGIGGLATWTLSSTSGETPALRPVRIPISVAPSAPLASSYTDRDLAVSADGTRLVFTAGAQSLLMLRDFDRLESVPVRGVTEARAPFFSPDGRWIGYFDRLVGGTNNDAAVPRTVLRRVAATGGPATEIATLSGASRGADWGRDGSIILATNDTSTGIIRLDPSSGDLRVLSTPDAAAGELDHLFPTLLPDERHVLFTVVERGRHRIAVLNLDTGERRTLVESGSQGAYLDTGHLVYADGSAIWAVPFDLETLSIRGAAVPVVQDVGMMGTYGQFAVTRHGALAYVPAADMRSLTWVGRNGVEEPIAAPTRAYAKARLSADGGRALLEIAARPHQLWMWDFSRATLTSLLFDRTTGYFDPIWAPDGARFFFSMSLNLFQRAADGTGTNEKLTSVDQNQRSLEVTQDGKYLIFERLTPTGGFDLMRVPLANPRHEEPLLQSPFDERNASMSPDGRWMAYESNETGQPEIHVRPYPEVNDAHYLVPSSTGGRTPVWSPNGNELFFVNGSSMMTVPVSGSPTFSAGTATKLFDAPSVVLDGRTTGSSSVRTYDISRDGKQFLMIKNSQAQADESQAPTIVVVQNWGEEVKATAK